MSRVFHGFSGTRHDIPRISGSWMLARAEWP